MSIVAKKSIDETVLKVTPKKSNEPKKIKKVKDSVNLARDMESNAIINTDMVEFNTYMKQKQLRDGMLKRIDQHDQEFKQLKKDLTEIKLLLKKLAGT